MVNLMEILIGLFITGAIFYARHFYGVRATLELIAVLVTGAALTVFYFTEVMKSVCNETLTEDDADEKVSRNSSYDIFRKKAAYYLLSVSTNVFSRIMNWCSETLEIDEKGDGYYEG